MAARTTQMMPTHHQGMSSRMGGMRHFAGTARTGTRYYAGQPYVGTRYYGGGGYYGGTSYYYGGGYPYYSYYSGWPYSNWGGGWPWWGTLGYYPYSYYGGYPYNSYNYSYYGPTYGYDTATVAAVQRRLGELGYYHGVVDGVMGPRTRAAIAAFESSHGLVVDARISRPLLDRLGLG